MPKVFSFANLVSPTCQAFTSLREAVDAGQATVVPTASAVRAFSKTQRRDYLKRVDTNWPCISLTEGVNPALRVSRENPPQLLHGFSADYDNCGKKFTVAELSDIASRCAYPPAAAGPSLGGDGVHAVWLFREPIPVLGNDGYANKVASECYKNLRAGNFVQGFDAAFKKPDRLLSIDPQNFGWLTTSAEAQAVDETSTRMWAANVTTDFEFEGPPLDLAQVKTQVDKLYPGRWLGDFNIGSRGCRFWDASSSDNTAAVVVPQGIIFFSNGGGFRSWASILGHDVAAKLTADSLAQVTTHWYYDASNHEYVYLFAPRNEYDTKNRTQFMDRVHLAGIEDEDEKKRAIVYVEDHKKVTAVVALASQRRGLITQNGLLYLNTTQTRPIAPVPGDCSFIDGLVQTMFGPIQYPYFMAWLRDSVRCSLELEPSYAQAIFLAGSVETGKSLLQVRVITPLLGGKEANPMPYLLNETGFNSELSDASHWAISDAEGARNGDQKSAFTQRIKAVCANPNMSVHAKYKEPVTLYLNARITFSFNKTAECLSVIPRLGDDVMGKVCLFDIKSHNYFEGLDRKTTETRIAEQLPAFAYFLLNDYNPPAEVLTTGGRYRTQCYHAPELLNHARAHQASSEVIAWIHVLFAQNEEYKEAASKGLTVTKSAAGWMQSINATTGTNQSLTPNKLSAHLHSLSKQFPDSISAKYDTHKKIYEFSIDHTKLIT